MNVGGVVAEYEAAQTSKRVRRAMDHGAAQGRPHGRNLYGYARDYESTGRHPKMTRQYPDHETGPVVRRIFDEYLSGSGSRTIATGLNADGIPAPKGGRWLEGGVRRVLRNPSYAGRRSHLGKLEDERWEGHEPIVSADTFDKVQARLDRLAERLVHQTSTTHLLTGVARCGNCGSRMRVNAAPGRKMYSCREGHCTARSVPKLDLYITGLVLERLSRPDVADELSDTTNPEADAARGRADELRAKLAEAFELWDADKLSASDYARMKDRLQPRIDAAEREARRALVPIEIEVPATGVDTWWDGLDAERQREVVAALIVTMTVHRLKPGMDPRRFYPELIDIDWR
jgi:site-specific DNA recombinase